MRIQPEIFLLDLKLKHQECNGRLTVTAYDHHKNRLVIDQFNHNGIETISTRISMPNNITFLLTDKDYITDSEKAIELLGISLSGIRFNFSDLEKIAVYHPDYSSKTSRSLGEYLNLPARPSLKWDRNGCITVNLFDINPFLYHLNIGTKIQF